MPWAQADHVLYAAMQEAHALQQIASRKGTPCRQLCRLRPAFVACDMPELDAFLHHRLIDVSGIRELFKRWYPEVAPGAPTKQFTHRAFTDIHESIRELGFYRQAIFPPAVQPLSDAARRRNR